MSKQHFEVIEHTADWAIRVKAANLRQLFAYAAEGMSTLMAGDLDALALDEIRNVDLTAYDAESLLVEWLNELAYWAEMEQLVFREYELNEVTPVRLKAKVRGGKALELVKHIKAVTYHNLAIKQNNESLETTIVFDV